MNNITDINKAFNITVELNSATSAQYQGHNQRVLSYVLCPQNNRVVSQDADGLHLWSVTTGEQLAHYPVSDGDEVGEEYYITCDENYLIASTFSFDPLDDDHCYQSLHIFYIGNDKSLTNSKTLTPCVESVMVVESLAIWCELTNDKTLIHTLGDVDCGREEGIKQHTYQVTWQDDNNKNSPRLTHHSEQLLDEEEINWGNDFMNMLPIVYVPNGEGEK